jgi:hypothetical protein
VIASQVENIMSTIDHVVCPIDLSLSTRSLLSHAAAWARWYEADLHALHVAEPPALLGDPVGGMVMKSIARSSRDWCRTCRSATCRAAST